MSGVLDDIRVAAFTHFATGPLAAQFLGALGADVIKVEAPFGDRNRGIVTDVTGRFPLNPYFITLNRNQRGIAVDLRSPEGQDVAKRLIQSADVLIENFKPGSMARLGLGPEDCRALNPRLVYCSISGFDLEGPRGKELGQDLLTQAMSGLVSLTGQDDGLPMPVGTYPVDAYTSLVCIIAVLSALRHRERTGEGQRLRTDMMSCALHMLAQEASYVMNVDPVTKRGRHGIAHPDHAAPYGVYGCRDGEIVVSLCTAEVMRGLAERLGILAEIEGYLTVRGMKDHRDEIAAALSARFAGMGREEAMAALRKAGLWTAPVQTMAEAVEDPAVAESGLIQEAKAADGTPHRVVVEPVKMEGSPLAFTRAAPAIGEHSEEVLGELGYSAGEIAALIASGAVRAYRPE